MDARIDRITGEFVLGSQKLGRGLKENEFATSELGKAANRIRRSGTRNWYEVWPQIGAGFEIGIILEFVPNGVLESVSAKFLKTGVRETEWSKSIEDDAKKFHDAWLKEQLGSPPYQFRLGK